MAGLVVVAILGAFLLGMVTTGFVYAYSIDHGKLPSGFLKQKDILLSLLQDESQEGGDANPKALGSGPS